MALTSPPAELPSVGNPKPLHNWGRVAYLYNAYGSTLLPPSAANTNLAEALQLAIWELLYDATQTPATIPNWHTTGLFQSPTLPTAQHGTIIDNDGLAVFNLVKSLLTESIGKNDAALYLDYTGPHDRGQSIIATGKFNFANDLVDPLESGDTATIGFWQNKNGQALIKDGGVALVNWLNSNFSNVVGNTFSDGFGTDDAAEVAAFYKNQFFNLKLKGTPKVDAQFMATAFATFFTSSNLSGATSAASYGFNVTPAGIGAKVVNVGSSGAAFGVADNTNMTIMSLLLATNAMTDTDDESSLYRNVYDTNGDGILDASEKALRVMANVIYTWINETGDI